MPTRRLPPVVPVTALAVALALALTGCVAAAPSATPSPSATASATPAGDGVLRIGTLFPVTGAQSYLGPAQEDGVIAAVAEINKAGGVLGKPVQLLPRDSGDASTALLEQSFADLLAKGADVVIGPSSSVLAQRLLPKAIAARVPLISPAATSVALSSLAADGYLFRTSPSAALQGSALSAAIGAKKIAYLDLADATGTAILATLKAGLTTSGGTLVSNQQYAAATTDFSAIIAALKTAAPDAVILSSPFSAGSQNTALITALTAAGFGGAKLWLTSDNMADYSQALPAGTLTNVNGILEGATPSAAFAAVIRATDPAVTNLLFAAEAYDATMLAALAAAETADDGGSAIARGLRLVSSKGVKCTTFAECTGILATKRDIDYDGQSGPIAFDSAGDPTVAHYGIYRYDAANRFALVGSAIGK